MALLSNFKNTTKAQAIALIISRLAFDFSKEGPSKYAILSQYISTLNAIKHFINEVSKYGTYTASGLVFPWSDPKTVNCLTKLAIKQPTITIILVNGC